MGAHLLFENGRFLTISRDVGAHLLFENGQTPHTVQPQRPLAGAGLVTEALGAPMARSTDSPSPTLVRQTGQIHTPPTPRHSARQNARPPRAKAKG